MKRVVLVGPSEYTSTRLTEAPFVTFNDASGGKGEVVFEDLFTDPRSAAWAMAEHLNVDDLVIPMTEGVVGSVAFAALKSGATALSLESAKACIDRYAQRQALSTTRLNPEWRVDGPLNPPFPVVLKAPASVRSRGVQIVRDWEGVEGAMECIAEQATNMEVLRRNEMFGRPGYVHVSERLIPGLQYEVNGVNGADPSAPLVVFQTLKHVWDQPGGKILEYQLTHEDMYESLVEAAVRAVEALDLRWTGWCVELKGDPLKVVEVNARLGEDANGYHAMLSPAKDPYLVLAETLREAWCS